jgi:hypothetical protein
MSRGELIIDDNQVKPAALSSSGDWATEYQQQYTAGPSWVDEYAGNQASVYFCKHDQGFFFLLFSLIAALSLALSNKKKKKQLYQFI